MNNFIEETLKEVDLQFGVTHTDAQGYPREYFSKPITPQGLKDFIKQKLLEQQQRDIEAKNQAYWERNQLVRALTLLYPSWLERHPETDKEWEDDWRWIVFVEIPTHSRNYVQAFEIKNNSQLSWHIHDSEKRYFEHLEVRYGNSWDGHTTDEKYERLRNIWPE